MNREFDVIVFGATRALLRRFALPKPGEGPNRKERAGLAFAVDD
jgi:hypothetical protein